MDLKVIIGHYQHDLSWVEKLKHPYIIYNKNRENDGKYDYDIPNVKWDAGVYFTYLVDHYDSLPDFVCFSQDRTDDHCSCFLDKVNNFDGSVDFLPLGITYERDQPQIIEETITYAKKVGINYELPIVYPSGAKAIISKKLILKNTKEFYQSILDSLPEVTIHKDNWSIEYLLPTIFHSKNIKVSLNDCI